MVLAIMRDGPPCVRQSGFRRDVAPMTRGHRVARRPRGRGQSARGPRYRHRLSEYVFSRATRLGGGYGEPRDHATGEWRQPMPEPDAPNRVDQEKMTTPLIAAAALPPLGAASDTADEAATAEPGHDATAAPAAHDGPERIPEDVRRNPWFRAALWVGLVWVLFVTTGDVIAGLKGNWFLFACAMFVDAVSLLALAVTASGYVWKD
jgi:hypothetical protein